MKNKEFEGKMEMDKLESLNKIANEMLSNIEPKEDSFQKILLGKQKKPKFRLSLRAVSLACSFALVLGIGYIGLNHINKSNDSDVILHQSAGDNSENKTAEAFSDTYQTVAAVPQGSVSAVKKADKVDKLWASGKKPFPMLSINGDIYRLLKGSVDEGLLGQSLGTVDAFNEDISSLDINKGISSNVAELGSEVYNVRDMEGAAVAAKIGGKIRLFQRSSFAGNALRSGETLMSTLGSSKIVSLQHSSLGLVDDESTLSSLIAALKQASKKGNSTSSGTESLIIGFENGIKFQLGIKGNVLYGCGSFSADNFIQEFNKLLESE